MKINQKLLKLILIIIGIAFLIGADQSVKIASSQNYAQLASQSLKNALDMGKPNLWEIKQLLKAQDFASLENLYQGYFEQFREDILYESYFDKAYGLFDPSNNIPIDTLDAWVDETESYIAYAARGNYKATQGNTARGGEKISDTPRDQIDTMQQFHDQAAKDLWQAIEMNPQLMTAYVSLIGIAMASNVNFTEEEVMERAIENDPRTYYVRNSYMLALLPQWGGSFAQMMDYAQESLKYVEQNHRIWVLQANVHIEKGNGFWRNNDLQSAVKSFSKALEYGDRVSVLTSRAACYYILNQYVKSLRDYNKVLYYKPDNKTAIEWSEWLIKATK